MKNLVISILLIVLVSGCSVLPREKQPTAGFKELSRPAKFDLKMGTELTNLRIDIFRNTKTEESIDILGNNKTGEVEQDYHPLGFWLNEILFFDINGNLSLVVPEILVADSLEKFEMTVYENENDGFFRITLQNDTLTFLKSGLLKDYDYAYLSDDMIEFDNGQFSKKSINITPEELIFSAKGLLQKDKSDRIIKTETDYLVPQENGTKNIFQSNWKTINLGDSLTALWYSNGLELKRSEDLSYFLYITNTGYEIYKNAHLEKKVLVSDKKAELVLFGKTSKTFSLK
ncbi:MAG: hypothetical protein K9H26_06925 [Prolixibacteraceae bacterium]|nr:hypothetical protein [Prolixibacteraceae bacterium]